MFYLAGEPYFVVLGVGKLVTVCGFSNGVGLELKSATSRRQKGQFFFSLSFFLTMFVVFSVFSLWVFLNWWSWV